MSTNKVVVLVYSVESGNLSYYGNPSKIIHTSRGTYKTQTNAGFVYGMGHNENYRGKKVELTVTDAGRVYNMRILKDAAEGGLLDNISQYDEFC